MWRVAGAVVRATGRPSALVRTLASLCPARFPASATPRRFSFAGIGSARATSMAVRQQQQAAAAPLSHGEEAGGDSSSSSLSSSSSSSSSSPPSSSSAEDEDDYDSDGLGDRGAVDGERRRPKDRGGGGGKSQKPRRARTAAAARGGRMRRGRKNSRDAHGSGGGDDDDDQQGGCPTVSEFYDAVYSRKRPHRVAPNTWRRELSYWRSILDEFGDTPLDELTGVDWDDYLDTLNSGATKRLHQTAYRAMLKMAVHRGVLPKMHSFDRIVGATVSVRDIKPFTVEEVPRLLDAAHSPMHRAIFAVGIGQGLRPGEIPSLLWEDVDWAASKMFVRGTKTRSATAWISMSEFTIRELRQYHELVGQPKEGLVFTWRGKPILSFKKALQTAARDAGLSGPDRRVHPNLLRHTFATMAAYYGVPLPTAQAILRHSNVLMLVRVYAKAGRLQSNEGLAHFPI